MTGHLSEQKTTLLRSIVRDRWNTFAPGDCVRRQLLGFDFELVESMEAWLKFDEAAAIASPGSFNASDRYDAGLRGLFQALGKTNVQKAFEVLAAFHNSITSSRCHPDHFNFEALAKVDREAFIKYAPMDRKWKAFSLAALVHAWLEEDFEWTMQALDQLGVGSEILHNTLLDGTITSKPFTHNFHQLPPDWRKLLVESPLLYKGIELDWLMKETHPQLSSEDLENIQSSIEPYQSYFGLEGLSLTHETDFINVLNLIKEGTWLSDETRTALAGAYLSSFRPDIVRGTEFLATIPLAFHGYSSSTLYNWKLESQQKKPTPRYYGPENFIRNLESAPDEIPQRMSRWTESIKLSDYRFSSWTPADFEAIESELRILRPEKAQVVLSLLVKEQLNSEIALTLFTKSCQLKDSSQDYHLHSLAKNFGKIMAERSCPAAAEWLDSLPPSRAKNKAMIEVFYLWSDYNKAEALAWAKSLPKESCKYLGIEKPD